KPPGSGPQVQGPAGHRYPSSPFEQRSLPLGPPWQVRPRDDPFYCYDNIDFIMQFPLSKDATIRLLNLNEHIIAFDGLCNCPLSPIIQLLVALRFYMTGTFHVVLGDLWGVPKSTLCRVVQRDPVSDSFLELMESTGLTQLCTEPILHHSSW
ncbi:hypothetical protein HPB47_025051, partial [Ixodes persulcatus]